MFYRRHGFSGLSDHAVRGCAPGFLLLAAASLLFGVLDTQLALAGSGAFVGADEQSSAKSAVSLAARQRLEAHGRFLRHAVWGDIWRPNQAATWRPFSVGRWKRDTSGALRWVSSEPFGDTVYRFGRWTYDDKHQWIWVPGSRPSPAWVTWRKGDKVVGWAPVAPVRPADARSHIKASAKKRAVKIPRNAWVFVPHDKLLAKDLTSKIMPATWNKTLIAATQVGLPDAAKATGERRVARRDTASSRAGRSSLGGPARGRHDEHAQTDQNGGPGGEPDWYEEDGQEAEHDYAGRGGRAGGAQDSRQERWPLEEQETYSDSTSAPHDEFDSAYGHDGDGSWRTERRRWRDHHRGAPNDFRSRRGWRARARYLRNRGFDRRCGGERGVAAELDDDYRDARGGAGRRGWSSKDAEHGVEYRDRDYRYYDRHEGEGYDVEWRDRSHWRSARGEW